MEAQVEEALEQINNLSSCSLTARMALKKLVNYSDNFEKAVIIALPMHVVLDVHDSINELAKIMENVKAPFRFWQHGVTGYSGIGVVGLCKRKQRYFLLKNMKECLVDRTARALALSGEFHLVKNAKL